MSKQYRAQVDGFLVSRFSGEEGVYLSFPETDAGEAGATLIPLCTLQQLLIEVGI